MYTYRIAFGLTYVLCTSISHRRYAKSLYQTHDGPMPLSNQYHCNDAEWYDTKSQENIKLEQCI